jgi:1-deoxy-D-xylulose-5-phosphate reductoisomerase
VIRRIIVLGSTGSIGEQALDVVRSHPADLALVGLAAGTNAERLAEQAEEFGVDDLAVADPDAAARLRQLRPGARIRDGDAGVVELASLEVETVLNAVDGARGLSATVAALEAGNVVALANKESLVVGGELVLAAASGRREAIVPVDSEHAALAQCLRGERREEIARVILTASGGPFRGWTRDELRSVTPDDALAHPTWSMGPRITVNSATLMNKGLELIEAHLLFGIEWSQLEVVVHPQSIVHSMVEFIDGSTVAQLSPPDMRMPIQLALGWPDRLPHAFSVMDWSTAQDLTFEPPDRTAFGAIDLAEAAGRSGGTYPAALNAANEQAVDGFLDRRIGFLDITEVAERVLDEHQGTGTPRSLTDVLRVDAWARARADEIIAARAMRAR